MNGNLLREKKNQSKYHFNEICRCISSVDTKSVHSASNEPLQKNVSNLFFILIHSLSILLNSLGIFINVDTYMVFVDTLGIEPTVINVRFVFEARY